MSSFSVHAFSRITAMCVVMAVMSTVSGLAQEAAKTPMTDAAPEKDGMHVVATVNGHTITEAEMAMAARDLDPQFQRLPELQQRAALVSALVEVKLLAAKARQDGLDQTDEHKQRMLFLEDRTLHSALVTAQLADEVSEEEIRKRYDESIAAAPSQDEIKVRHILLKEKGEAEAVIVELDNGADFAELAKEKSTGPSGSTGGDLDYIGRGVTVPEFEKAAFDLATGSYSSEPVQTSFGWHVIQVEDRRIKQPPDFASTKDSIRSAILRERYFQLVDNLRNGAAIEFTDPELEKMIEQLGAQQ